MLAPACKGQMLDAAHLCRTSGAQLQVGKLVKGHVAAAWWCSMLWPGTCAGVRLEPIVHSLHADTVLLSALAQKLRANSMALRIMLAVGQG